jgi:RNA polymerase sigma factor (sigma-70 family)
MPDKAHQTDEIGVRRSCRAAVQTLIARYEWALLSEDDLVERVAGMMPQPAVSHDLEKLIISQYVLALYEACRQSDDLSRRELGYGDLFRYLYRAAYNRWPDIAEDVTQRALMLIYRQIDRCQTPAAFLIFALFKLRHAAQQEQRARSTGQPLESLPPHLQETQEAFEESLLEQEQLRVIADAINRIPDARKRQALILRFLGGLNDDEISTRLGVSVGHVRALRFRAVQQLREDTHLREYFSE